MFCCFNNNYKILPPMFDVWMRLLARIAGSVLWLSVENDDVMMRLRAEGRSRGPTRGFVHRLAEAGLDGGPKILWGDGQLSIGRLGSGHLDQEAPHGICRDARITC